LFSLDKIGLPSNFDELGYGSRNVISNLGSTIYYIKIYLLMLGLTSLIGFFKDFSEKYKLQRLARFHRYLRKTFCYNFILRLFLETFLDIALSSLLNLKEVFLFK
jgi:site-specific recombinase